MPELILGELCLIYILARQDRSFHLHGFFCVCFKFIYVIDYLFKILSFFRIHYSTVILTCYLILGHRNIHVGGYPLHPHWSRFFTCIT